MGKTKKVKTAGRFGPRYGVGIRKKLLKIEGKQQKKYNCPFCGFKKVQRKAPGIFSCRKCGARFAGGAYLPTTLPGTIIKKTVAQKSFVQKEKELEKMLEEETQEETKELPKTKSQKTEKAKRA